MARAFASRQSLDNHPGGFDGHGGGALLAGDVLRLGHDASMRVEAPLGAEVAIGRHLH